MRTRIFAFLVYLIFAIALMVVLSVIIDEHMSERKTQWDERVSEFEQAVSLRPNGD